NAHTRWTALSPLRGKAQGSLSMKSWHPTLPLSPRVLTTIASIAGLLDGPEVVSAPLALIGGAHKVARLKRARRPQRFTIASRCTLNISLLPPMVRRDRPWECDMAASTLFLRPTGALNRAISQEQAQHWLA